VGTARYIAPEQATQRNVTGAVDQYALGCMLYEMLAGAPTFDGGSIYEVLDKHIRHNPLPVRGLRREVPEELDAVVSRLLEKDPAIPLTERASGAAPAEATMETREKGLTPAESVPAADDGFDIFAVHQPRVHRGQRGH
jgi:serine/threonine protein kinase